MNILEFKIGDIIHRVEYGPCNDRSFMANPYELLWIEKGIIFLQGLHRHEKPFALEFDWQNGWDFYPVEIAQKLGIIK